MHVCAYIYVRILLDVYVYVYSFRRLGFARSSFLSSRFAYFSVKRERSSPDRLVGKRCNYIYDTSILKRIDPSMRVGLLPYRIQMIVGYFTGGV